jgi:hypothetical protein
LHLTFVAVRNFSLPRDPHTFWKSQTSPSDSCLFLLPLPPPLPPSALLLPRRSPPAPRPRFHLQPLQVPTRRPVLSPPLFPSLPGLARTCHDDPEPPPAATSSSPWSTHHRALFSYLSRVVVSLQRLHLVLPVPVPNSERSTHISPPPSSLAPATHGTPVGSQHQTLSMPHPLLCKLPRSSLVLLDHSLPSNCNWSFVSDNHRPPPPSASPWAARPEPFHATTPP